MIKIYPLVCVLVLAGSSTLAQLTLNRSVETTLNQTSPRSAPTLLKSATIWTSTFDNPSDWVVEADDTSHGWLITSSSVGWRPTDKIISTSGGNYALFRNGNPSTNTPGVIKGKEWSLTTAAPIDLSIHPHVAVSYQIWGMRFLDDLEVQYSTDNINWKIADKISKNIRPIGATGINDFTNPTNRYSFMPDAGGASSVWIRVRWINSGKPANDGIAYSYQLDDFAIIDAPAKELVAGETFPGSNTNQPFFYQQIPLSQAHLIKPRITVSNTGISTQQVKATVSVLKEGVDFGTFSAISEPMVSGAIDTITIPTFKPTAKGLYTFNFLVEGDSKTNGIDDIETVMSDNIGMETIRIGDVYADDKNALEWSGEFFNAFREGGGGTSVPYASISASQAFEIFNLAYAHAIITVFPNGSLPVSLDQTFQINFYRMNKAKYKAWFTLDDMQLVSSREYQILAKDVFDPAGTPVYTRIEFNSPVAMQPDFLYIATINASGGNAIYNLPLYSSTNRDFSGGLRGFVQTGTNTEQYALFGNVSPFIQLDFNQIEGVKNYNSRSTFQLAQNFPNPFNGNSTFGYSLTEAGKASVSITDITGKIISTTDLGTKAAGSYTHTFNSNDLTAGIYFYSLTIDGVSVTKKMVVSE